MVLVSDAHGITNGIMYGTKIKQKYASQYPGLSAGTERDGVWWLSVP